ncbi:L-glyceraldehyde 3-phosphate reductase [Flavobacterium aquidurense]|uniref:L-glyceraldehyde 3-phosphate reductase n=1 Tax=Flavobacterium frigidimaris TaxID=262320 RepID=A0ABX4BMG6_FLAFR|nr:aldo/keto reductase [Flavobacterium frigidimaris]OXA76719.1 L-glyceraldehyde 3-phosphate reductase [Flavobacterium frigidimaris]SDZ66311.1 L-glyceraldehyde 3-phosphate reductase [Flavobacterium aquidurense]
MKYNRCGMSGLLLPQISLGLWHNFGSVDSFENAESIAKEAFDKGITHFDIANNYGPIPGSAETNFGEILSDNFKGNLRDEIIISTKAGYTMWDGPYGDWGSRKYLLSSLDQSLKRLKVDYVDIFYSHRPDPETPIEETMMALDYAVRSGKALYVGISNYSAEQTRVAVDVLKQLGTPCLIHQAKYSMLVRWVEERLLDVLEQKGVGCIAFSPLAQGLLTDKYLNGIPQNSRAHNPNGHLKENEVTAERIQKLVQLNEIARNRNQSLAQMALAWLQKDKRVTSVLIGASSVRQLNNNIDTLQNLEFTLDELNLIETILK